MIVLPQDGAGQVVTGALVSPVSIGAGILAGSVSVVQQTLVDVQTVDGPTEPGLALGRKGQFERQPGEPGVLKIKTLELSVKVLQKLTKCRQQM